MNKYILNSKNYKMRNLYKMNDINDGTRTLYESIISTEIIDTFEELKKSNINFILIGGLALSYYVKPRFTTDIDLLFLSKDDFPIYLNNFSKNRSHSFLNKKTNIEVELLDSTFINIPNDIIKKVFDTAKNVDGIKIASPSGLIALKLFRFNRQDQADIENLIDNCEIELSIFNLPNEQKKLLNIFNI